jgi:capsular exopolysaccharide synthesis family protein
MLIPDARILSRAMVPSSASYPPKGLILAITFPAAILFGLMLAFIVERLDNGFRVATRAEQMLGYPVFATIPDASGDKKTAKADVADLIVDQPLSSFTEAIRGLQMGISLSNVDQAPKLVVVTSALPGEGKTTTALSLARHVSQTGQKTVIIDGDLRRPNVKSVANIGEIGYDLIDVLVGKCTLDQALIQDTKSRLFILPSRQHAKNAPELIESQAMATILKQLRSTFDCVIVDSAPVLPVNDTKILARLADTVLFVIRWEETPRNAAADAVKALKEVKARIGGLAITRADIKRYHYYSFGYGSYNYAYSKYYG